MGDNSKHYIIDYNIAFTRSISTQFFGVDDFSKVFVYIPSRSDFLTINFNITSCARVALSTAVNYIIIT